MYQPPLPKQITLPLVPNDDPELTCFVCKDKRTCDLAIVVRVPGLVAMYGIHARCVEVAEKRGVTR